MGKSLGKILGTVAPIAAGFIPGIGPLAAAAIGAGGGLLSGGGLRGALSGAITSGLGSGLGSQLGGALGGKGSILGGLGGFGEATQKALGNGLLGATAGGINGGVRGAAIGGGLAGLGSYANAGGFDGAAIGRLGDSVSSGFGDLMGSSADKVTFPGIGQVNMGNGTGIKGAVSNLGSALGTGAGGGSSSYGGGATGSSGSSYLGPLLGMGNSLSANNQAQKDLLEAQQQSIGALNPYLNSGAAANDKLSSLLGTNGSDATTADILASDPAYKFQMDQGNQALDRMNASRGGFLSGSAVKAGQEFTQGLANKTVNDYYSKLSQQSGQGLQAAGGAAQIFGDTGSAKANAGISSANIINQGLGSLFGSGAYGRPRYDPNTGRLLAGY